MAKCCICWLVCCSLWLPLSARAAEPPVSAEFFLQSIEPAPSMAMLYDFFDIYDKNFAACRDTDTYLRALSHLAASGDTSTLRDRLRRLEACPSLSATSRQQLQTLLATVTPKTGAPGVASSDLQATSASTSPAPLPIAPPVETPDVSAVASPDIPPDTSLSASSETPQNADVPSESSSSSSLSASPAPTEAVTPAAVASSATTASSATSARSPKNRATNATKTPHLRRTSLPVVPSLPIPSRIVPPAVLTAAQTPDSSEEALAPPPSPASETSPVPQPAEAPAWRAEAGSRVVHRSGDAGTSRLLRLEHTASLGFRDWTFSATSVHLDAGGHGSDTFAGTPFRGQRQRQPRTEETAFIPQIAYDSHTMDIALGTTPLGGAVSPLPTFRFSYTVQNRLKLSAFQESVTDSLLAYTGVRDSFSGERMGRVLKTGTRIGWDDTFAGYGFYGAAISGAWLYGENVKDNTQIRGEIYVGRTFGAFAIGSYSAVDHYRTDLNHYTYGHGGYYSPYLAASSVIFGSWEYAGKAGRLKADVSSGFLYERTRDSDLYYGLGVPGQGVYRGETHRRFTVNAGLEGVLNLGEQLSLNSTVRVINAGDFTETRGALQLKYVF